MSQPLPFDEIKFDRNVKLKDNLSTPADSDVGYFAEIDLKYPDEVKEKTKNFPFSPQKKNPKEEFRKHMNVIKNDNYTQIKLIFDWTYKKFSFHYRKSRFYVRHGKTAEKVHEKFSIKQSKWLEYI